MNDTLETLIKLIDSNDHSLKSAAAETTSADLIESWHLLDENQSLTLFLALDQKHRVEVISDLSNSEQIALVTSLSVQATRDLLEKMDPDDLVDLIQTVPPDIRADVLSHLSEDTRKETEFLLRFDDDQAAGLMTTRYAAIREGTTVGQALTFLRSAPKDLETIYYIYLIDSLSRLTGVVSLRQIIMADDHTSIDQIAQRNVISVNDDTDQEDTAKVLQDHDLIALPVVNRWNRLLGIVTFDDMIDVIRQEQSEDVYRMSAITGNTVSYLDSSLTRLVLRRLPWIIILLLAGTITTNVLAGYSSLITSFAFLALFIPVITQTGGNTSAQSSALMIRGLATGDLNFHLIGKALFRELITGIALGILTGLIIFLRGILLPPGVGITESAVIAVSLSAVVLIATLLGTLIPFIVARFGGDPAVAAGPLMSTLIDVVGLTIYFEVARWLLL